MTAGVDQALQLALAYHQAPAMLPAAQGRPLPEGIITLLRLAGGDQAMAAQCAELSGETEAEVVAAAVFFVQQVMFASSSRDSYRVLGVAPDAPDALIKEHYRWLVRWLHPDRNTDDWDSVYADRVNRAWQTLRSPDRRRDYDAALQAPPAATEVVVVERPFRAAPVHHALPEPALLSSTTVQRLPVLVLGGLGAIAVLVLSLMWLGDDPARPAARVRVAEAPVEAPAALTELAAATPALAPATPQASIADTALAQAPQAHPAAAVPDSRAQVASAAPSLPVVAREDRQAAPLPPARTRDAMAEVSPAAVPAPRPASPPPSTPVETRAAPVARAARTSPAADATATSAPSPAPITTTAPSVPDSLALQEAQAHALLRQFSSAYQAGDINALMRLFTADARNNRGGREAIVYDYQSLFSVTQSRELALTPTGWIARDEGGTLLANYKARVRTEGRLRSEVTAGTIRFDLRLVNGQARISEVRHDDAR